MREIVIEKNDSDQRVDKFLMKALPNLPKSLMYKSIRNKKIKVNRKRCEISQRLREGDTLQLFLAEDVFEVVQDKRFLQASSSLDILYEDAHILVVNKPVGLLAHSDMDTYEDNLIDRIKRYLYEQKEYIPEHQQSFAPALCHRIDRNTQGIVIAAKDAASLRLINEKIRERLLDKYYLCIVEGHMPKENDVITLYHKKDEQVNYARLMEHEAPGYKEMKTGYHVLERGSSHDLLEIALYSGRSHQIRSAMAYVGHPLLSDVKYGGTRTDYGYQALCAYSVKFHFQEQEELAYLNGKTITIPNSDIQEYFHRHHL